MNNSALAVQSVWLNSRAVERGYVLVGDKKVALAGLPLPYDGRVEKMLIGAILSASITGTVDRQLEQVPQLRIEDFYQWELGVIYGAILKLHAEGRFVDELSLCDFLRMTKDKQDVSKNLLMQVGGEKFIAQLLDDPSSNLTAHSQMVREHANLRLTMFEVEQLRERLLRTKPTEMLGVVGELNTLVESAQQRLLAMNNANGLDVSLDMKPHLERIVQEHLHPELVEYMKTGFADLDEYITGWAKRRLYLVGGSNGMGKSAFLLSTGLAALREGKRVCFVSLELSKQELLERIACSMLGLDSRKMSKRQLDAQELARFQPLLVELDHLSEIGGQMRLVCLPFKPTIDQFQMEIEKVWQTGGFDLLIIDYVGWGRFSENDPRFKNGNTVGFTGAIFNKVDSFKTRYNCPVVVAVQINREHERNADKRPELRNIADSKIGGDNADVVMFVHRPDRYDAGEVQGRAELLIRKNRYGEEGTAYMKSELQFNRFSPWTEAVRRVELNSGW